MHDLSQIYKRVFETLSLEMDNLFSFNGNSQFYPNPPQFSDLELVSLALTAESAQVDSENLLWSKLKKDYPFLYQKLPHRTKYNVRKKRLSHVIGLCIHCLSEQLIKPHEVLIVDSMPLQICALAREKISTICRKQEDGVKAQKGYHAASKQYYIGYKLHLMVSESGVYVDMMVTPANVHDIFFLKEITSEDDHLRSRMILGDRAYLSNHLQFSLFETHEIDLKIPYRRNQKDKVLYPKILKIKRRKIETVYSQLCDEFWIKRNYAKSFEGLYARIVTKLAAKTFKQYWNLLNDNPINRTKHAFAA